MSSTNVSSPLLWIHEDCLSETAPPFALYPQAPAVFVFDESHSLWSLKRIQFVYECLLELPVIIERGDAAAVLQAQAKAQGTGRIATVSSPSPHWAKIRDRIQLPVEVLDPVPFVELRGQVDLKRFSRYWKRAQTSAFLPTR
ncbi:MAG: hypothetical protein K2X03_08495 [Bryobacteraceae bacterium]|nr:hypothetical protein [Bryobacteraceae bacterium]